jgi:hypothetical protein
MGSRTKLFAIAGGLIGEPSAVAGWCKPAEKICCRAVLLLRARLWLPSAGGASYHVATSRPDVLLMQSYS